MNSIHYCDLSYPVAKFVERRKCFYKDFPVMVGIRLVRWSKTFSITIAVRHTSISSAPVLKSKSLYTIMPWSSSREALHTAQRKRIFYAYRLWLADGLRRIVFYITYFCSNKISNRLGFRSDYV